MKTGYDFLLVVALVGWTQVSAQTTAGSATKGTSIAGNLYTNAKLGFSFQFPEGWTGRIPNDARSGTTAKGSGFLLRSSPPNSQSPRLSVFFHDLRKFDALMPGAMRTGADFLFLHRFDMEKNKFEVRHPTRQVTYGTVKFHRLDFHSRRRRNRTYQATVATIVNQTLLAFMAAGTSEKEVEDVLTSLETLSIRHSVFKD